MWFLQLGEWIWCIFTREDQACILASHYCRCGWDQSSNFCGDPISQWPIKRQSAVFSPQLHLHLLLPSIPTSFLLCYLFDHLQTLRLQSLLVRGDVAAHGLREAVAPPADSPPYRRRDHGNRRWPVPSARRRPKVVFFQDVVVCTSYSLGLLLPPKYSRRTRDVVVGGAGQSVRQGFPHGTW